MRKIILIMFLTLVACNKTASEQNNTEQAKHDCEHSQPGIVDPEC